MALVGEADLVPQHAGHQPAYGVGDHHCRKLAAGQNKVAQGDFLVHALVNKALVDALIVPADENDVLKLARKLLCLFLVEGFAAGG